jgi:hypothetical protein
MPPNNKEYQKSYISIDTEIAKCDVVCANCRWERSFGGNIMVYTGREL